MMRRFVSFLLALLTVLAIATPVIAEDGGRKFEATLTGAAEVPVPGDSDGSGSAVITVNHGQARVCWEISVTGIAPTFAAHIHLAPVGVPGGVVVPLSPPTSGSSSGCTSVDPALAKDILKNPEDYYVNVHNADFPGGALRGQLQ